MARGKLMCEGRDPRMWEVGDPRNPEAIGLCRRCPGCPPTELDPLGVIRDGIPYNDRGRPLPLCPECGQPNQQYRGGKVGPCGRCSPRPASVPVALQRETITRLYRQGWKAPQIARQIGATRPAVNKALVRWGLAPQRRAA